MAASWERLRSLAGRIKNRRRILENEAEGLKRPEDRRVFTIGFSGKTRSELMRILRENRVRRLLDVRWFPGSPHRPDVSKNNLAAACRENDIDYVHLKHLGAPPELRKRYKDGLAFDEFMDLYARYIAKRKERLEELAGLAGAKASVLFCAEREWRECHRSELARILERHGFLPVHL